MYFYSVISSEEITPQCFSMHVLIDKAHETCTNDFLSIELASFHQTWV